MYEGQGRKGLGQVKPTAALKGVSVPSGTGLPALGHRAGNTASPGLVQPGGRRAAKHRTGQERLMDTAPPSKGH